MRVLVTGAQGRLGQWTLRELLASGHEAVGADQRAAVAPDAALAGVPTRQIDMTDVGQVAGALACCDAVIHLAAIPSPGRHADEVVFGNNVRATFATLQAATLLGVRRAVVASSVSALGMAWAARHFPPQYAPIDEAHPLLPEDPYGLSKEVSERTGAAFARRGALSILALRLPWLALPGEAAAAAARPDDGPAAKDHNLWAYVDVRDAARACRLAVEAPFAGFAVVNVTAADTLRAEPTEALIRRRMPGVELRAALPGYASGWTLDRARDLLGYLPAHSWRDDASRAGDYG